MSPKPFPKLIFILKAYILISLLTLKATANETIEIGAIVDVNSRIGKEQKTAIAIAVENYNHDKINHKQLITVHFRNTSKDAIQDLSTAEDLVEKNNVKMIVVGMQTWEETALVADIGKRHQIPIISFVTASYTPELVQLKWPFLVQMCTSSLEQINCISAIVRSYQWRRIIIIYEDDMYSDSSMLAVLSETLKGDGAEIEHQVILPQTSSLSDPREVVRREVVKLLRKQSRVFVVLRSSVSTASHLFKEAKGIGLMGRDSAWILSDSLADLLDSVDSPFVSSIQGALGIKNQYSEATKSFQDFKGQFQKIFRSEYPMEDHSEPGIHALKAYDSITAFAMAVNNLGTKSSNDSKLLKNRILSSNFTGLSGQVRIVDGALSHPSTFRIVNVVGHRYKGLGFWSAKFGFSEVLEAENGERIQVNGSHTMKSSEVKWPGELNRVPKGWAMPTDSKPLIIGVPGRTSFEKFVKVEKVANSNERKYSGFCIDLFKEVLKILEQNYTLPYEFEPYDGSYPDLVQQVINRRYDAIVGDMTILAERIKYVEFTQPFAESGLTMVVPVKFDGSKKAWMFLKPFTISMWIVTGSILVYTMLVVWFMEHQSNPEFRGRWKDQLGTAMWFTFSSLFFAHRENIKSNYTKIVVVVWLFLVFVLTSSYTASLTSMLTVPRLEPSVKDINWIKRTNTTVGCDGDSFVKDYLRQVLELQNIKNISNQEDYPKEFESGNIKAAFLEIPYQKVFLREHCNQYVVAGPNYRFGGLAFVFQKGSPLARDVSEAILTLTQDGTLNSLEERWFALSRNCDNVDASNETESLTLGSFWGLYLVSGATSTVCLLFFIWRLCRKSRQHSQAYYDNVVHPSTDQCFWTKTAGIIRYYQNDNPTVSLRRVTSGRAAGLGVEERGSSSRWHLVSPSDAAQVFDGSSQHPQSSLEMGNLRSE
ncbi:PREDICTED: glutamate receptor 2.9-like [Nicotiana attenuata]|uniref:Glutamate receptor n=1 Tax=Nicotiana attenuata TaxID=49451 RepID=A0A1J6ITA4_NICAT|nr:PREDICTED: glutamate receptor 2.9-like [Nicotiana attenuata]OIT03776.1 glutamate receptor 2.9 [Nicotiana attenuata]